MAAPLDRSSLEIKTRRPDNPSRAKLEAERVDRGPKAVNNVLVALNTVFKTALE